MLVVFIAWIDFIRTKNKLKSHKKLRENKDFVVW